MNHLDLKPGEEIKSMIKYQDWVMILTTESRIFKSYPTPSGEWHFEMVVSI